MRYRPSHTVRIQQINRTQRYERILRSTGLALVVSILIIGGAWAFIADESSDLFAWLVNRPVPMGQPIDEQSASLVGLSHRWAIKSILVFGLFIAALAGVAVWLQTAFALFGPRGYDFPHFTIEREDEKLEKRKIIETMDATLADGSDEEKRGNSSKLLIRQIDDATFAHADDSTSQRVFKYLGMLVMIVVLSLVVHTFNFWSWLI